MVTSNNIPSAYDGERSTKLHFLGKYKEDKEILHDKIHSNLNEEISKSHFAFKNNDWKIQQIHHVISKCEKLPPSSPFKLPSDLLLERTRTLPIAYSKLWKCVSQNQYQISSSTNHMKKRILVVVSTIRTWVTQIITQDISMLDPKGSGIHHC